MKNNFSIRPALPSAVSFLEKMLFQALFVPPGQPAFPPSILQKPELAKYLKNWGVSPYDLAFIASENDKKVGAIWGRIFEASNPGYGFVDAQTPEISMSVLTNYRNKGIGTKLIQSICEAYALKGIKQLSLSVDLQNPARVLYERTGFQAFQEAGTALMMVKDI